MPELPEVETVKRTLAKYLIGRVFSQVCINRPEVIANIAADQFAAKLRGRRIMELDRRGKYLLFHLSGSLSLVVHLRMTGRLVYSPAAATLPGHTHVIWLLDNGWEMRFTDTRRFGRVWLYPTPNVDKIAFLHKLGPEPLGPAFTIQGFREKLARSRRAIKQVLLDQEVVAGIGNIYADEILFQAGIAPLRPAQALSAEDVDRLYQAVRSVLRRGIEYGGTTFRDYVDGEGNKGGFQQFLNVYQRTGQPCRRCGSIIAKTAAGGRSSHFCPRCQPLEG